MSNYIIEGNINFQEELYKLLDEESENEDDLCQITGLPLKDKYIVLECKHHFNYEALYKEIYKQKYEFKTYDPHTLTKNNLEKFKQSKLDYFIKCPYCRNIQFTILPYYEELGLKQIYGINSLDKSLPNTIILPYSNNNLNYKPNQINYGDVNYTYYNYGILYKWGQCCEKINNLGDTCKFKYVATIPNTQLSYCRYHYKLGIKNYKIAEKKKLFEAKIALKTEKYNEKTKLLELVNLERETKGLKPLKRLIKKKLENIVEHQEQSIQKYIPEEDGGCSAIIKTGPNKGSSCGKKISVDGLCKRHCPKDKKEDKNVL